MEGNEEQGLAREINRLFQETKKFRNSIEFTQMMRFLVKQKNMAPYNSFLLYIQRPDISCATTRAELVKNNRRIKANAQPLLILKPFHPIEFVYDLRDTEGEEPFDFTKLDHWKTHGTTNDEVILEIICNMRKIGLVLEGMKLGCITGRFAQEIPYGQAVLSENGYRTVQLRPGSERADLVTFAGVLMHEYAHHLLGHLGPFTMVDSRGRPKLAVKDHRHIDKVQKEWEAELVAYIVCNLMGLEKDIASYMAQYISEDQEMPQFDFFAVLKAAKIILDKHTLLSPGVIAA